ncbi:FkbM family methyltransferase [Candidatus Woesearchaeota archaeon]|jgi:FkbM family methyltransferase|nr:FkbM family methyltransferase [Candidatus Woesearchaeota archaeon]MBT5397233.1 FkbM family methyltransferase [Candidatus Woesearchaeota archaeon]MBT5924859.1 FkbM family methyltransferase [Candidatus Woesearchaeota archaeon]MBT6367221.1 FkbM family methyltransferase [Candidatus Woesearchaeota archaeon]MBT7762633.1 FkbM family methyltransferase [Candidatus Woesearchaeota archaeon]
MTKFRLAKLYGQLVPDSVFKHKVRCVYQNIFGKNVYTISFKENMYYVTFPNFTLKFRKNPCGSLATVLKGYLKYHRPQKNDVVIDAGASGGVFSLIASKFVGDTGQVLAFEPDTNGREELLDLIALNCITNVDVFSEGLWSTNTQLRFKMQGGESSFILDPEEEPHLPLTSVIKLDSRLKELKIQHVNFIKMDIEGAEIEALKGCSRNLSDSNVHVAIASYHKVDGAITFIGVERLLLSMGYVTKTGFPQHLTTWAKKVGGIQ